MFFVVDAGAAARTWICVRCVTDSLYISVAGRSMDAVRRQQPPCLTSAARSDDAFNTAFIDDGRRLTPPRCHNDGTGHIDWAAIASLRLENRWGLWKVESECES